MKIHLWPHALCGFLAMVCAAAEPAAKSVPEAKSEAVKSLPRKKPDERPSVALHEWGVFTVLPNQQLANIHNRREWESLPKFVYGQLQGRLLPAVHRTAIDKPVIFFHAEAECTLDFTVAFPGGAPAVWWPATSDPVGLPGPAKLAVIGEDIGRREPPAMAHDRLSWSVQIYPDGRRPPNAPDLREVPAEHWFRRLRTVKADEVITTGDTKTFRKQDIVGSRERELFVYYDGAIPHKDWLAITATGQRLDLANRGRVPLLDVTVIERTLDGRTRLARLAKLEPEQRVERVELTAVATAEWPKAGTAALTEQLTAAGLNRDEAASLVEIWQSDFFEEPGLRVLYRLPQEEYDRLLPLTLQRIVGVAHVTAVRVGLVFHPDCGPAEPELLRFVAATVKRLDDEDFAVRERATAELAKLGRAGRKPLLDILNKGGLSPESKARIMILLSIWRTDEVMPMLKPASP